MVIRSARKLPLRLLEPHRSFERRNERERAEQAAIGHGRRVWRGGEQHDQIDKLEDSPTMSSCGVAT